MGLKHKAKKGTVVEVNGVKVIVLSGSPKLEIVAPPVIPIRVSRVLLDRRKPDPQRRS
jgi:hypothetical protein